VDGAAVLHGGLIWAERDLTGELLIRTLPAVGQALSAFRVFDTGAPPHSTGTVVAAVRERVASEPDRYEALFERMGRATRRFRDALLDDGRSGEVEIACLREYEASLEELGVVPGAVRELVAKVEAEGGAAKISGAGALEGPGAGCLLVYHPDPAAIASWGFLEGLERYPVMLGGPGLRLESE
jgi:mevalonate kinase